jgi:hypothetical protein
MIDAATRESIVLHNSIHFGAALLAEMLELLMVLLPDEHCEFLDSRDTEIFALKIVSTYRRAQGEKRGPPLCHR